VVEDVVKALLRRPPRYATRARYVLGAIRLVNGAVGLLAPQVLIRQLGGDPQASPSAVYAFRLFGVRTALIGADLLRSESEHLDRAVRRAPLIHASDTTTAVLLATSGALPKRAGIMISAISGVNTVLALLARAGR
jgi:hypothetical protein